MKPPWLEIAEKEVGEAEWPAGENPRIIEYDATTTLHAEKEEIPWCSSFVNWCLLQASIKGTNNALASSWLDWGVPLEKPTLGCVCVVKRKGQSSDAETGSATGFHVAFWLAQDSETVTLLGGNQGDQVKVSRFFLRSYEIKGYRVPKEG